MVAQAKKPSPHEYVEHDHIIVLHGATWADYQRVLELRGDRRRPKITYCEGTLQLMTTSRKHEGLKSFIGHMLEMYCVDRDIQISPYGEWTIEDPAVERAVQPDECYIFGPDDEERRVEPDLAIEVVLTSSGIDKLEVYRLLGVREVWFWQNGIISIYVLRGRRYRRARKSKLVPAIDLALLAKFAGRRPLNAAIREFRAARAAQDAG